MESDVTGHQSRVVLKTVSRMPRTFMSQLYAVDMAVTAWVSLGSLSYAACAFYLSNQSGERSCKVGVGEQVASVEWTFQVQTAAFGAVLLLNLLNLGMRQHLLPFKCNLLLLYINAVAFATDLLLWRGETTVLLSSSGRAFAPLRYVQWCHSTPTMIYMLALLADCGGWQLVVALLSDVVMVATGLAACYTGGLLKDVMTLVSFGTFSVVLYYVYAMFHKTLSGDVSPEQRSTLRTVLALLLALWSAFPVVWLAADWHLMGPQAEAVCWGVCDYLAKVVFSSQLWQSNLTEVQLRRDRALEAWEASNRVEAVARLTALLKQRDDLLSTLSHELRTPLAGIVALSETLCQEVAASLPRSAQNLATVRATATCMLNIVTSTLDSFAARQGAEPGSASHLDDDGSWPEAPSVPLSPLDLRPLVETVTTVLRPLAHDGVMIVSDLPNNLPPVAADATRLSQVLYNLVGNAMRFTSHGEVRVAARLVMPEGSDTAVGSAMADPPLANSNTVGGSGGSIWRYARPRLSQSSASSCSSVVGFPVGTQVEVSVEDTGVGIAQELLDELFLPYRTGHSAQGGETAGESSRPDGSAVSGRASTSIGGTGLGLYLVRLALRAQGSDISADSAPGIGSVFRFRLQIAQHQNNPHNSQSINHCNGTMHTSQAQPRPKLTQQQHVGALAESLPSQRLPNQPHLHADDEPGSQMQLSGLGCEYGEARCSSALSGATAASDGSGADRGLGPPSSPKPWIASATARLVKLSSATAAVSSCRAGGSGGGAAQTVAATMALAESSQRPSTGVLFLREGLCPVRGRPLRMSLDEKHRNLRLLQPPPSTGAVVAGERCKSSCAAGCCVAGPPAVDCPTPAVSGVTQDTMGVAASAGSDAPRLADTAGGMAGSGLVVLTPQVRVLTPTLTPTPTPTAATSRASTAAVLSLTPFDVAHAIEEGRALVRGGLRPNFRHRNNGTLQVLSVDDDPINQLVAGQMLMSQSWKVVKCMNGPEALAYLQLMPKPSTAAATATSAVAPTQLGSAVAPSVGASSLAAAAVAAQPLLLPAVLPDCVLLDVMMPGMSGFEVCRKLRQHFSSAQLPIIIVSAKGDSAAVDEAFDSGADDYMTKPYKRTEMVARIRAQIRVRDSVLDAAAVAAAATTPAAVIPQAELSSVQPQVATATGSVPAVTTGGTPRACITASGLQGLLGCSGAASELPSPLPPPFSSQPHSLPGGRPTSVDVLLLQQPTPDAIKMRMEVSRGGLDGSWGKVGLYKRDRMHARTNTIEGLAAPWDASARIEPTNELVTAPAAIMVSPQADLQQIDARPPASEESSDLLQGQMNGPTVGPVMVDVAVGTSKPLPLLSEGTAVVRAHNFECSSGPSAVSTGGMSLDAAISAAGCSTGAASVTAADLVSAAAEIVAASATAASVTPEAATTPTQIVVSVGCGDGGEHDASEPAAAAALMREVLMEVRRGRAAEADIEKLTSRLSALRTACCTLAAERDGWRRQARDLRALLAAGFSGAAVAAAAAAAASPGQVPLQTKATGTMTPQITLTEALAAAHGSRSSADSLGAAVNGGGCTLQGATQNGMVAAQLEDLKKEAALLRQQLSIALASVGGNVSVGLGVTDTGGSRTFGLTSGGPTVRQQQTLMALPHTSDSPQSAAIGAVCTGDAERSGAGGDAAPGWGVPIFPNAAYGPSPDIFLTSETSGLSAGSGPGGGACDGCTSADGGGARGKPCATSGPSPRSVPHTSTGLEANLHAAKQGRKAFAKATLSAAAMEAAGPGTPEGLAAASQVAPPKQVNGVGGSPKEAISPGCVGSLTGGATSSTGAATDAALVVPEPLPPSKADSPQLRDLHGSSAQSNSGRWDATSASVEEEMSQLSSVGRAPVLPTSSRGSRSRAGGGGSSGTGAILRLLCSKGAVPGSSPHVSPPRRISHQQHNHRQQQQHPQQQQ